MWFDHVTGTRAVPPTLVLRGMYEVKADASYDVVVGPDWPDHHWVLHTWAGRGRMSLVDRELTITADTLCLVPQREIRRFWCDGDRWDFWCTMVGSVGGFGLPLRQVLAWPYGAGEQAMWRRIFGRLQAQDPSAEVAAALELAAALQGLAWEHRSHEAVNGPHEQAIRQLMRRLHEDLRHPLTVELMAAEIGLSERRFRALFREVTGKAPKRYLDELRLQRARERLRFTNESVTTIARELGYGSVYHFSRAFREHTGRSPSHWRRGAAD